MGKALAIVLNTIGCAHARSDMGGCTMCSYLLDGSNVNIKPHQIVEQFETAYMSISDLSFPLSIKLYTSGSFLDEEEIPLEARENILKRIGKDERVSEVVIESRPEYITPESVKSVRSVLSDKEIEFGVGLETINDKVRQVCINKGFTTKEFLEAVESAQSENIGIRAYVLLKPPFLTERDALLDVKQTIQQAVEIGVTTISINPVNVQKKTLVEKLWNRHSYRPPWLWSVVEILIGMREKVADSINIVCDPVAAGKSRGPHNCGICDQKVTRAIREFSLNQNPSVLQELDCDCKETWHHVLVHEDITLLSHRELTLDY
jgi:radical SAM enzyme (TIGR01210 family)